MRPVYLYLAVLLLTLVFAATAAQQPLAGKTEPARVEIYQDAEAYKVYAAVLPIDSWYWESSSTILILREIAPREWANGSPRDALHGDVASTAELKPVLESFDATNKVPMRLNSEVDLHRAHRFVEKAQLDAALNKNSGTKNSDAWEGFRQDFPNTAGYLILSGVGFNSDKTLALVYVEHRCGNKCGAAHYYVLQKRDGLWVQYFPQLQ